jgi:cobalamin synthase
MWTHLTQLQLAEQRNRGRGLVAALLPPVAACLLLFPLRAVSMLTMVTLLVFVAAGFFQKRIGGITGDCLGAPVLITELAVLTVACSLS